MDHRRLALAAALGLVLAVARAAPAVRISGGGPPKTDCYAEFEVEGGTLAGKTKVECVDGTACDADGTCDGKCTFGVAVCRNQTNISACTPAPPTCIGPPQAALIGLPCSSIAACEPFTGVVVSLKKAGKKPGEAKIRTIATSASAKQKTDKDRLTLPACPTPIRAAAILSRRRAQRTRRVVPTRSTWWLRPKGRISTSDGLASITTTIFPLPRAPRSGLASRRVERPAIPPVI